MTTLFELFSRQHVYMQEESAPGFTPACLMRVNPDDWGRIAEAARTENCRWVAAWGEDRGAELSVNACFEKEGAYAIARTGVPRAKPVLPSHSPYYAAADRPERHIRDMFGIAFTGHPDTRRWTRHQAWKEGEHPLRREFPADGHPPVPTAPDEHYPFLHAQGGGVYEIPVGPVHAGIIEPGHFRFQAVGETILNLEERLGYTHKGIEKIAEGRDAMALARLAGRVSGDSTVAHAWAACQAMEKAAGMEIPERAEFLRAIMAERERIANHLGDIGAICNDVAFTFAFYQFGRLREVWQRVNHEAYGHRFMMDCIIPGGVTSDMGDQVTVAMEKQITFLRMELAGLYNIIDDLPSLEDRLDTTGYLNPDTARAFGALGYVGRASGMAFDVRKDAPYAPYNRFSMEVPVYQQGDVATRVKVRAEEILASCFLMEKLIDELPAGKIRRDWRIPPSGAEGLGFTEGFRGEIMTYVRFGDNGRIARFFPRDPSWLTWPTLEKCIRDNIVPDFPVCNKSINGSYSGHDL